MRVVEREGTVVDEHERNNGGGERRILGLPVSVAVSIGQRLRARREDLQRSHKEIAARIRIRTSYLEAMETGEWEVLPQGVNGRGLIRVYARDLGIDIPELDVRGQAGSTSEVRVQVRRLSADDARAEGLDRPRNPARTLGLGRSRTEKAPPSSQSTKRSESVNARGGDDLEPIDAQAAGLEDLLGIGGGPDLPYPTGEVPSASSPSEEEVPVVDAGQVVEDFLRPGEEEQSVSENVSAENEDVRSPVPESHFDDIVGVPVEQVECEVPHAQFDSPVPVPSAPAHVVSPPQRRTVPTPSPTPPPMAPPTAVQRPQFSKVIWLWVGAVVTILVVLVILLFSGARTPSPAVGSAATGSAGKATPTPYQTARPKATVSNLETSSDGLSQRPFAPEGTDDSSRIVVPGDVPIGGTGLSEDLSEGEEDDGATAVNENVGEDGEGRLVAEVTPAATPAATPTPAATQTGLPGEQKATLVVLAAVDIRIQTEDGSIFSGVREPGRFEVAFDKYADIFVSDGSRVELDFVGWTNYGKLGWEGRRRRIILNAKPYSGSGRGFF